MAKKESLSDGAMEELAEKQAALKSEMERLQNIIHHGPKEAQKEMEERLNTMPPPDELADRKRENHFQDMLNRGGVQNHRRHQARSALLFLMLLLAIVSLSAWVYKVYMANQ